MATILGVVCARKGSKRLVDKNIRLIGGISLIERAIHTLNGSGLDEIILASDFAPDFDLDKYGARHIFRPANISYDDVPLQETVKWVYHSLGIEYDYIVYLHPDCPQITAEMVKQAITTITSRRCNVVRSYNRQGHENGLITVRTSYLLDHFIDVYCDCIICAGEEIHDEKDYREIKKMMEAANGNVE